MTTEKLDQKALDKLIKARTSMLIEQPFFGTLSMRLKMVQDSTVPTLCVDGKTVRYNPAFILRNAARDAMTGTSHAIASTRARATGPAWARRTSVMPTLVRALLDHPSPSTVALQRCVMLVLIDVTFTGWRWGRALWPR